MTQHRPDDSEEREQLASEERDRLDRGAEDAGGEADPEECAEGPAASSDPTTQADAGNQ
jgi:hypothetical protein